MADFHRWVSLGGRWGKAKGDGMKWFKTENLLRALRRQGVEVHAKPREYSGPAGATHTTTWYWAENARHAIEWFDQGDGLAACVKVRPVHEHDDPTTDYFPGSFVDTIKQAVEWFVRE